MSTMLHHVPSKQEIVHLNVPNTAHLPDVAAAEPGPAGERIWLVRPPIFVRSDLDDSALSPNAFRVLGHLARRTNDDYGYAWPSYQTIGDHCFGKVFENRDTRRRYAMKAVKELVSAGWLEKTARFDRLGDSTSNAYQVGGVVL